MKRRLFCTGVASVGVSAALSSDRASAAPAADSDLQAWVGAELWLGEGASLQQGQILVRGEKIVGVGPSGPLPRGTRIHDAKGMVITPGWVACETALGLVEIEQEGSTVDSTAGTEKSLQRIRASHSVVDGYNPLSTLIGVAQRGGVTSAVPTPSGGLVSGTSAWVDLGDPRGSIGVKASSNVQEHVALHVSPFGQWGSRPRGMSLFREALDNARLYAKSPRAFDEGRTRPLGLSPANLKRLSLCFSGLPVVVKVSRAADIRRTLQLAADYSLNVILSGAEEGWLLASEIAKAGAVAVVNPLENLPVSFAALRSHRQNPARLAAAGVRVAFSSFDAHKVHNLRQLAGNSVAAGMSRPDAVKALSSVPAQAFGQAQSYGGLMVGKVANLVVWTGDPFEMSSWAKNLVVRGRSFLPESRQDALYERYRDLKRIPVGDGRAVSGS